MAAVTSAVVVAAGTAYAGHQSARASRRASNAQAASMDAQTQIGRDQLEFAKGEYERWREQYAPIIEALNSEAMAGREPDYAAISADVTATFQSAMRQTQRGLERYGLRPGDGQFDANRRQMGLAQAGAEVMARQGERRNNQNDRFNRLTSVAGMGLNMQSNMMSATAGAAGGLMNAHGQHVGVHGQNAQLHGQNAGAAGRALGGMDWGRIIDGVFNRNPAAPDEPGGGG